MALGTELNPSTDRVSPPVKRRSDSLVGAEDEEDDEEDAAEFGVDAGAEVCDGLCEASCAEAQLTAIPIETLNNANVFKTTSVGSLANHSLTN